MEKRTYRLKVCGTVEYDDNDREIEELMIAASRAISMLTTEPTDKAIQELEECATELSVELQRI